MSLRHVTQRRWTVRALLGAAVVLGGLAGAVAAWAYFSAVVAPQSNTFAAAPVDHLVLSPASASITAGTSQSFTVTAMDAANIPLGTVTALSTLSIAPNGACTGNTCTATVAGAHTVTAAFWGVSGTASLTVAPSAATSLAFSQSPSSSTGSVPFPTQPIVALQDAYGNIVTSNTSAVTLGITTGTPSSGGPGALGCSANPLNAVAGSASFSGCAINTIGTGYRLHATDGSLTSADSAPFSITGGALSRFAVSNPGPQTAGVPFTVTVSAQDAGGNTASGWTGATLCVTFTGPSASPSLTGPVYPAAGSCPVGQSALAFSATGQASATITLYDAQALSLSVTSGSTPAGKSGSSGSFTVSAAALDHFVVPTPVAQTVGVGFSATVAALDAWGNAASGWTSSTACVSFSGPSSSPNGTAPGYPANVTCPAGQSALTFGSTGQATASMTLYAAQTTTITVTSNTSPAGKTGTSGSFAVASGALTTLAMSTPATQTAGVAFAETLSALDTWGNPASGWTTVTNCVTLTDPAQSPNGTAPAYPGPGALCTAPDSALTFDASGRSTAATTLFTAQTTTLSATSVTTPAGVVGTSSSFVVNAATPTTITQVSGAGQVTTLNTPFANPLAATVVDGYGNPAAGVSITFTAPTSGSSAIFAASGCTSRPQPSTCVATSNSAGQVTSAILTANATAGTYAVTASAAGTNTLSYAETNSASGTLHIRSLVTGATSGSTTWNGAVTLTVVDSTGTPVNGVLVTGGWSPTTLALPTGCTTNAAGQCTITPTVVGFPATQLAETWTASGLTLLGYIYSPSSNVQSSATVSRGCAAGVVCATDLGADAFVTTVSKPPSVTATLNSSKGTAPQGSTVFILVARDGTRGGDSVVSVTGSAISAATPVSAVTANLHSAKKAYTNLWVYRATGTGVAAGTVTVAFNNADNIATLVQVVAVAGNNTANPVAQTVPTSCTSTLTCTATATANLATPGSANGELILTGQAKDTLTAPTTSATGMTRMFWDTSGTGATATAFNVSTWQDSSAQAVTTFTLGTAAPWGTIAVEVARAP